MVAGRNVWWSVVAAPAFVAMLVSSGIPVASLIPPAHTVALLVIIPIVIGTFGTRLRESVALSPPSRSHRRAATVDVNRLRRGGESSGGSTPSPDQTGLRLRLSPLELPDGLAG